ncbi:MAG: hypothetical protein KGM46_02855 [Pseudomonadota bacterium]|nr:hypothetical protein [Pseudomonadota bacterium]
MKGRIGVMLAGCLVAMFAGAPAARADGGRIAFAGAISSPTCSPDGLHVSALTAQQPAQAATYARLSCPVPGTAVATAVTTYSLSVADLGTAAASHDPLLAYFMNYLNSAQAGTVQAKLFTQSFS